MYARTWAIRATTANTRVPSIICRCSSSDCPIVRPVGQTLLGSSIGLTSLLKRAEIPPPTIEGLFWSPPHTHVLGGIRARCSGPAETGTVLSLGFKKTAQATTAAAPNSVAGLYTRSDIFSCQCSLTHLCATVAAVASNNSVSWPLFGPLQRISLRAATG